jgi:phage baseplate assembly protein W
MDRSTVMSRAISFPYTISPSGVVQFTDSSAKIYLDRVLTLLSFYVGQRPMQPTYGVDWSRTLFENNSDARIAIPIAISEAVSKWIPQVSVISVDFAGENTDGTENVIVSLKLPDDTLTSLTINTGTINYDGTMTEEY